MFSLSPQLKEERGYRERQTHTEFICGTIGTEKKYNLPIMMSTPDRMTYEDIHIMNLIAQIEDSHVFLHFKMCVTIDAVMMMSLYQQAPSGQEPRFCTPWDKVTKRDLISQGQQMWSRFTFDMIV